jgi:predicted ArsR family transcriptional regulator
LAVAVRERCGERPTRTATVRAAAAVLGDHGYEPRVGERSVVLSNCPFGSLIPRHAELVCAMNLALLDGFARALPGRTLGARLEPTDGKCCVRLDLDPQPRRRN